MEVTKGDMDQIFVDKMQEGLGELGITLSDHQMEQFYQYYEMLIEWNKVMNLTAITELDEVISKHFIDSLALVKAIDLSKNSAPRLIDVGTGAGFPGIPLKIAFPELRVTLLDSLNKRISFLNEVIAKLDLKNVKTIHGRAEDFGHDSSYREQYDYCVSRAVANTATLSEYCVPFLKTGGFFIPYKSGKIDEELKQGEKAIKVMGGKLMKVIRFQLLGADAERTLIVIKKIEKTGKKYPRKAGMPSKSPII